MEHTNFVQEFRSVKNCSGARIRLIPNPLINRSTQSSS